MSTTVRCEHRHVFARPLSAAAAEFVAAAVRRTYAVAALELDGDTLRAEFAEDVAPAAFADLARRLAAVAGKMTEKTLYAHRPGRAAPPDPLPALAARGDVRRIGRGLFVLQGEFLRLQRGLDELWRRLALARGAVEQDNPGVWPVDLYRDIDYFADFPHQVLLAAPLRAGHDRRTAFARAHGRGAAFAEVAPEHLAPSAFGLQSAVCDACYFALRGATAPADALYTTRGKVYRNECSPTDSLDRLTAFTVRDVMFVGSREYVLARRQEWLAAAIDFLASLDLDASIVAANDPFFAGDAMAKTIYQHAAELKHELLARLPFAGRDVAVGSLNLHQDFFGRAFGIRRPDGQPVWSGCLGLGFERLVYALYAQFGLDVDGWPAAARALREEAP